MASSKSLIINSISSPPDLKIEPKAIPTAGPGTAVVHVLNAAIGPQTGWMFSVPIANFQFPVPSTYGPNCVGRIVSVGVDSTSLKEGQLVLVDSHVTARDDPNVEILMGLTDGGTEKSKKLANEAWRDGCWTTHVVVPLENATPLDEDALVRTHGYELNELSYLARFAVAYGAVSAIDIKAGETVIVGPATGGFGGAAAEVASARGARVIAFGRNKDALAKLKSHVARVETVALTGDAEKDLAALSAFGPADAYIDFSPFQAQNPTHIGAGVRALRRRGRVVLMGGVSNDIALPYTHIMKNSIEIKGRWMYSRKEIRELVKMVETGVLKLGKSAGHEVAGTFALEDWDKAFAAASKATSWGQSVLFTP
jgi:threonine dehydrogenase-like Zn-dependent dehydrogenase